MVCDCLSLSGDSSEQRGAFVGSMDRPGVYNAYSNVAMLAALVVLEVDPWFCLRVWGYLLYTTTVFMRYYEI